MTENSSKILTMTENSLKKLYTRYCRIRPLSKKELSESGESCVKCTEDEIHIDVGGQTKVFEFERVYGEQSTQEEVPCSYFYDIFGYED